MKADHVELILFAMRAYMLVGGVFMIMSGLTTGYILGAALLIIYEAFHAIEE